MIREYFINERIRAGEVRVIDTDGKQLGVMPLSIAISKAREKYLDLILIVPGETPPVCKIADFGKFKYEMEKKKREARRGRKEGGIKELKLTPKIGKHDLLIRINRAKEFLEKGHKVKITLTFRGREMAHKEIGQGVLKTLLEALKAHGREEAPPKFEGRNLISMLVPAK